LHLARRTAAHQTAAHRKSDRRRDDLYTGGFRKRASNGYNLDAARLGYLLPPGPSAGVATVVHILDNQLGFAEGDYFEEIMSRCRASLRCGLKECMEHPLAVMTCVILHVPSLLGTRIIIGACHDPVLLEDYGLTVWSFPSTH
jgi:hypothetical protein